MKISSPSRSITFFSVLFIAILIMSSTEWRFMFFSQNSSGIVVGINQSGSYMVQYRPRAEEVRSIVRPPYGIPSLELNETVSIRYTLNADGSVNRSYVSWFWSIFHNKILVLIVLSLPWFAFVWAMPAKWTLTLGGKRSKNKDTPFIDPERSLEGDQKPRIPLQK